MNAPGRATQQQEFTNLNGNLASRNLRAAWSSGVENQNESTFPHEETVDDPSHLVAMIP